MTALEIWVIYCAPVLLVFAGALLAWHNHLVIERARARDHDRVEKPTASR